MLEISRAELQALIGAELQKNPALELEQSLTSDSSGAQKTKQTDRPLVPDVCVKQIGNQCVVILTDEERQLRVNPLYERMAARKIRIEGHVDYPFFIAKAREAKWFIRAVEQRQTTLLKVTDGIFGFQRELLEHGLNHIRPITLRQVAEDICLAGNCRKSGRRE